MNIEHLVQQAIEGNKSALEGVIATIQDDIYYLSLRMLASPDDAKDATQEILIRIITKLSTFQFQSQFKTWAYRVASNFLITEKKKFSNHSELTFDIFKADLESDLQDPAALRQHPQYNAMLSELRVSCTFSMLLCLNSAHRMAYILGDIFEMEHQQASEILSITKANFRQQLSRARTKIVAFTTNNCGLVSSCAQCRCDKKLTGAIARQRVNSDQIRFTSDKDMTYREIKQRLSETQESLRTLTLQQAHADYKCPIEFGEIIESLVMDNIDKQYTTTPKSIN